jgi:hypothetical protein
MRQVVSKVVVGALLAWSTGCRDASRRDTVNARPQRDVVLTPSALLPPGSPVTAERLRAALEKAGRAWSYPQVPCTSVKVSTAAASPQRLAQEDGVNLIVLRWRNWCHNDRCGATRTYPLRAAGMTTVYPRGATGANVREGDIELNAVSTRWLSSETHDGPSLDSVLLHEVGHILGFSDLGALPHGAPLDSVMREGAVAQGLTHSDVRTLCQRYPR